MDEQTAATEAISPLVLIMERIPAKRKPAAAAAAKKKKRVS
jgi:hypothetical protein